jgi:hypothetical protein
VIRCASLDTLQSNRETARLALDPPLRDRPALLPFYASPCFGAPQRVVAAAGFVEAPTLSADGRSLYVHSKDGNRFVIYRASR